MSDFKDCRIIRLKNIQVLKREFFENVDVKELKDLQNETNRGRGSIKLQDAE